jgi:hypothetical protein
MIRYREMTYLQQDAALEEKNKNKYERLIKIMDRARIKCLKDPKTYKSRLVLAIRAVEDIRQLSSDQKARLHMAKETKIRIYGPDPLPPKWRTKGIRTLGPFGIQAGGGGMELQCTFGGEGIPGTYVVIGPLDCLEPYLAKGAAGKDGGIDPEKVEGSLSPRYHVTIKSNDPAFGLLRLPENAESFAWINPIITKDMKLNLVEKSPFDMILFYGGFVYFDKDGKFIQANSLWPGTQMHFNSPLPLDPTINQKLKDTNRWREITLEHLRADGATHFAWLLPKEFKKVPNGGFAYKYDDEEINNYFSVASPESINGLTNAYDFEDSLKEELNKLGEV